MAESLYFPGLSAAQTAVRAMDDAALYAHLDALYGRDQLPDDPTHDDLVHEALQQTMRDFKNPAARAQWDMIETFGRIARATKLS